MQIDVWHSLKDTNGLENEWNQLLKKSASNVPFLRYEYLQGWWQTLGGGEWPAGDYYSLHARLPGGELAGIAPLFFSQNREGEPALLFQGCIEISDYLDFLCPQELLPEFVEAMLDHLSGPAAPPWTVLDWYNFLDASPSLPVLKEAAAHRGWTYTEIPLQHCPYIPLPGDWETYLAGVDGKQRHEIRRKMRRFETSPEGGRWYIVTDPASLDQEVEDFLRLMAYDPAKKRFLTESMHRQMHLAARSAFEAGWLQLAFIEIGGEKAAGYINFDYENRIWVYNSGIDFRYREFSPGWVLLAYLLEWANKNKRQAFDFMRGDEEYKYRFGATDRRVVRVTIRRQAV